MGTLENLLLGSQSAPVTVTKYDLPLLAKWAQKALVGTDALGRTNGVTIADWGTGQASWLSSDRTNLTAVGYAQHAVAYAITTRILQTAAAIPWYVFKIDAKDRAERDVKHPLNNLLYRPNPRQNWAEFTTEALGYFLTTGNSYPWANKVDGKTTPQELWNLPAPKVVVVGGDWLQEVDGYKIAKAAGGFNEYEAEDVLHLKYWNPEDARYGLSPLAAGIRLLTSADSGLAARVRQYQNQGPPGIIYDDVEKPLAPWTDAQSAGIRNWFRSFFPGGRQSGEIPIVGNKLGFLRLGLSPVDLDVLAALQADTRMICNLFGFPAELLNDKEASTYNNVESAYRGLYTSCIIPLLRQFRDGLNRWLGKMYGDGVYLDFDLSGVPELQANKKELAEWLALCPWVPLVVKNEIMGLPHDPALKGYLVPASLVYTEQLSDTVSPDAAQKMLQRHGINDYRD